MAFSRPARPGLGEQSKRLADAIHSADLAPLLLYAERYMDTSEVLPAIVDAVDHLNMLLTMHATEVLQGARAEEVQPGLWRLQLLPSD